jgi:hypothetical protein
VVTPYIGSTAQPTQTFNAGTTQTVTGLSNGQTYTFKVAAINGVGTGNQSTASGSVTLPNTPGAPGTPTGFPLSLGRSTLTWTTPSNGGSPITGYVVTPYINGVVQTAQIQTFNSTLTTETVTGLTTGRAYTFRVAAINAVGTGTQSGASFTINI